MCKFHASSLGVHYPLPLLTTPVDCYTLRHQVWPFVSSSASSPSSSSNSLAGYKNNNSTWDYLDYYSDTSRNNIGTPTTRKASFYVEEDDDSDGEEEGGCWVQSEEPKAKKTTPSVVLIDQFNREAKGKQPKNLMGSEKYPEAHSQPSVLTAQLQTPIPTSEDNKASGVETQAQRTALLDAREKTAETQKKNSPIGFICRRAGVGTTLLSTNSSGVCGKTPSSSLKSRMRPMAAHSSLLTSIPEHPDPIIVHHSPSPSRHIGTPPAQRKSSAKGAMRATHIVGMDVQQ